MSIEAGARAGHDRARRHDVRLPRGPRPRAEGRRLGRGASTTGERSPPTTTRRSTARSARRGHAHAVRHLGHQPGQGAPLGDVVPDPSSYRRRRRSRGGRTRARPTWVSPPACRCATSPSTRSSSARAPTGGSRTCAPPPTSCAAARCTTGCARSSYRARWWSRRRPSTRGSTRSSPRPGSSGGRRAARCAWA